MMITIPYWKRLRRAPYQTISSIFMIFVTLLVFGIFLLLIGGLSGLLSYFESKPQLTVFFRDEKDKSSIDNLIEKLKSTGKVADLHYISKEQALSLYREQNKDDPLLLEMVTADILPASLEIFATSPQHLAELAEIAKADTGIDEVVFQKDVVETLISWTNVVRRVGLVFVLFLSLSTLFILLTTIGLKIALHKEEIEILKLIGANSWYIKKPFIVEGLIYGMIGSSMASIFIFLLLLYFNPMITSFLRGINRLPLWQFGHITIYIWPLTFEIFLLLWVTLLVMGVIIGFLGSFLAVSRFMKVKT